MDPSNRRRHPLTVYAPASIGNMSVGFDALGLALAPMDGTLLGDLVRLEEPVAGADWKLELEGLFASALFLLPGVSGGSRQKGRGSTPAQGDTQ
jgi:hypothetical protein